MNERTEKERERVSERERRNELESERGRETEFLKPCLVMTVVCLFSTHS